MDKLSPLERELLEALEKDNARFSEARERLLRLDGGGMRKLELADYIYRCGVEVSAAIANVRNPS